MSNCKEDFLKQIEDRELLCAIIQHGADYYDVEFIKKSVLPIGFNENELKAFLQAIDYSYDSGYGGQEVFGTIWYEDGTWSERGEYDGSEWWEYKSVPPIPAELENKHPPQSQSVREALEKAALICEDGRYMTLTPERTYSAQEYAQGMKDSALQLGKMIRALIEQGGMK